MSLHEHHHHHHHRHDDSRLMAIVLAINVVMLVAGVVGGLAFDSLALLADAGHVLADVAAIGLALFAGWMATRPASPQRTFGFRRTEIFAALVNGLTLVAVARFVVLRAVFRLSHPPPGPGAGGRRGGAFCLAGHAPADRVPVRGGP